MAQNRYSGQALATQHRRWLGGGAVALVHLAFLTALLLTDRLTFHRVPDTRPMTVYRLPDDAPRYTKPSTAITLPSSAASVPSSVLAPRINGPMILIQPETPLPPNLRGLDLSVKQGTGIRPLSQDDLLPSKETRLKRFFAESEETHRLGREPSAGKDCEAVLGSSNNAASLGESAFHDPIPIWQECTPRDSAKALTKRNDRFAPQ